MLKLEDIRFPITFISIGVGTTTFANAHAQGIRDNGRACTNSLRRYIEWHNSWNHENGDYAYEMAPEPMPTPSLPTPPATPTPILYRVAIGGIIQGGDYFSLADAEVAAKQRQLEIDDATVYIIRVVAHIKQVVTQEVVYA